MGGSRAGHGPAAVPDAVGRWTNALRRNPSDRLTVFVQGPLPILYERGEWARRLRAQGRSTAHFSTLRQEGRNVDEGRRSGMRCSEMWCRLGLGARCGMHGHMTTRGQHVPYKPVRIYE